MITPVFISWSGDYSGDVAKGLRRFIKRVLQATEPFHSGVDIEAGVRWFEEIQVKLEAAPVGVLCVTADRLGSAWLNFEAGALANSKRERNRVVPYCIDLDVSKLGSPLGQLNAVMADSAGTRRLIETINHVLPAEFRLSAPDLDATFKAHWNALKVELDTARTAEERRRGGAVTVVQPTTDERLREIERGLAEILSKLDELPQELELALESLKD